MAAFCTARSDCFPPTPKPCRSYPSNYCCHLPSSPPQQPFLLILLAHLSSSCPSHPSAAPLLNPPSPLQVSMFPSSNVFDFIMRSVSACRYLNKQQDNKASKSRLSMREETVCKHAAIYFRLPLQFKQALIATPCW